MASASKINLDKEREELFKANALLDDIYFPKPSIFTDPSMACCQIVWLRPHAVTCEPELYNFDTATVGKIQIARSAPVFDWFLVPLAHICLYPNLVYILLSANENFSKKYGGMFKVRLYSAAKWIEIVIDDRLPFHTCQPPDLIPYIVPNTTGFWLSIIVKAYAKLHGSYERLVNGNIADAYSEFTSGITEIYDLIEPPPKFHVTLKKYFDSSCLMSVVYNYHKDNVKHVSHWAITDVACVGSDSRKWRIMNITIKFRYLFDVPTNENVFDHVACSDLLKLCMKLNSRDNNDSEFWLSYSDFIKTFSFLYVCTLDFGTAIFVRKPKVKWNIDKFSGTWFSITNSSHSLFDPNSIPFWSFPQFKFELRDSDQYRFDSRCEFLVNLQQAGVPYNASIAHIGFYIFKLVRENELLPVNVDFFRLYRPVTHRIDIGNQVQARMKLPPGAYMIIPVAEAENHNDFFLTIHTEARYDIWGHISRKVQTSTSSSVQSRRSRDSSVRRFSRLRRVSQNPTITPSPSEVNPRARISRES